MQKVHVTPWITAFWLKEFRGLCSSTPLIAVRMQDGKTQDWGSIPGLPAVICDFGWLTDFSDPRILSCKMYMATLLATYQDESEWIFVRYTCLGTAGFKKMSQTFVLLGDLDLQQITMQYKSLDESVMLMWGIGTPVIIVHTDWVFFFFQSSVDQVSLSHLDI